MGLIFREAGSVCSTTGSPGQGTAALTSEPAQPAGGKQATSFPFSSITHLRHSCASWPLSTLGGEG